MMKIFTDNNDRIIDIGSTIKSEFTELEVPDGTFGDITDAQIKCYACVLDAGGNPSIWLLVTPELFDQVGILEQEKAKVKQNSDMVIAEMTIAMGEMQNNTDMAVAELTILMANMIGGNENV